MPRRRLLIAICLCGLGWAAPVAHATPMWLPAKPISSPPASASFGVDPKVTMGPSGDIAATWTEGGGVYADVRQAGASSSSQELISTYGHSASWPSVAVNASGKVVVAWIDSTTKQYEVATRRRGEAFSAPIEAGPTGGPNQTGTSVAIDNAGDVLLGETEETVGGYFASYAWMPAGGTFSTTPITEPGSEPSLPVVAMDGAGDAVIAWNDKSAGPHDIARAITRPAGGAFGPTQNLTNFTTEYAYNVAAAIGGGGQPAVVWQRGTTIPPYHIEASTSASPAAALSAPQTISPAGGNDTSPAIAVGGNGEVVSTWEQRGATETIDAASATAGSSFAPASEVSAGGSVGTSRVAMDAAGDAVIAWTASPAGVEAVDAVTRTAAGTLGSETTLSASGEKIDFEPSAGASVGMDSAGDAVVGWEHFAENTILARIYDATGPVLKIEAPASAIVGQSIAFTVAASDLFTGVGFPTWSFGDGAAGLGSAPSHTYTNPGVYDVFATAADQLGNATTASTQITVLPAPVPPLIACADASSSTGGACPPPLIVRCVVPSLKGLSSAAAKRHLLSAHCRLGKVRVAKRYKHSKRLIVSSQSVRARTALASGASVSITLKPTPSPHKKHRR
jgi:PKD domain